MNRQESAKTSGKLAFLKLFLLLLLLGMMLMGKMDLKMGKMRRSLDDEMMSESLGQMNTVNMERSTDEVIEKKEDRFSIRRQILELGCKNLQKMQELVDEGDFDKLLKFHEDIYNRKYMKSDPKNVCRGPSASKKPDESRAKLEDVRHKVNIFYEDITNMTICLPPKAGTTNFQDALAQLRGRHGRGILPRLQNSDYRDASDAISKTKLFVLNTRNPFERVLSAWRDKFSSSASESRQDLYKASINVFEEEPAPDGYVSSFPAFVNHLAANPSEFTRNRHWRSTYYHCSPCHFPYELITHLETIDEDFPRVWEELGHEMPKMKEQYKQSPMKSKDASFYYRDISSDVVKKLYINYYQDFVLFGYSPDLVKRVIRASNSNKPADLNKQKMSRALMNFEDQTFLNEICY
ncbi:Oidioi.mRNA.OKI2018_I69.PAR.g10289.t1.cds [Oikopleura dioica]|uniref:Carbohydrate sulfotransferase n=1 Tax=Oikopleura dioica TaxID=34765 RepID=A0ABN7RV77_OIKDI|nr:Oidioi.mRNA.OKI2018_I69.PAR.g10289.t1.cds [Oikopleura dioica]